MVITRLLLQILKWPPNHENKDELKELNPTLSQIQSSKS